MKGKTIIITGANSGIGFIAAKELSKMGANVILACRNSVKGEHATMMVHEYAGTNNSKFMELDVSSFQSIQHFVDEIKRSGVKIDVLVNNAGIGSGPPDMTVDGLPMVVGTNYLGPFLLTLLLLNNRLFNEENNECRIVNVSSVIHSLGRLTLENGFEVTGVDEVKYMQSKLAVLLFNVELSKRLMEKQRNIKTCSLHPGVVLSNFFEIQKTNHGRLYYYLYYASLYPFGITPEDGAQTILYCVLNPNIQSGKYYDNCQEGTVWHPFVKNPEETTKKLWQLSENLVKNKLE